MINIKNQIYINNRTTFIILSILAFVIYGDSISHEFVHYDDHVFVKALINNQSDFFTTIVWAFSNNVNSNWHPLTILSLVIDYQLYGTNAGGFHVTNVILHLLNSILIFMIVRNLVDKKTAIFVAIIFIAHPLNVEPTAWVSERKGVLGAFFALVSILMFLKYKLTYEKRYYLFSIFTFLLSLMSKAVFVTLPFIFVILDVYLNLIARKEVTRRIILTSLFESLPFLFISLIIGIVTIFMHQQSGALGVNTLYPIDVRIAKAIATTPIYLKQFIYPVGLYLPYPYILPTSAEVLTGLTILFGFTILSVRYLKNLPELFLGWFWFLILIIPVSGILQSGFHSHADRYAYMPLIGLIIFIVVFITKQATKFKIKHYTLNFILILIAIFLTTLSWFQHSHWKNTTLLFYNTYNNDNSNFIANTLLASQYIKNNEIDIGMQYYKRARKSQPTYLDLYDSISSNLINKKSLDEATLVLNDSMDAIKLVSKSTRKKPHNESRMDNLLIKKAKLHLLKKDYSGLIKHIDKALLYLPNNFELYFLGGTAYYRLGKNVPAEDFFMRCISLKPQNFEAHFYLLRLYVKMARTDDMKILSDKMLIKFPEKSYKINKLIASHKKVEMGN